MTSDIYAIAQVVAEELSNAHSGYFSDKKANAATGFFLDRLFLPWALAWPRSASQLPGCRAFGFRPPTPLPLIFKFCLKTRRCLPPRLFSLAIPCCVCWHAPFPTAAYPVLHLKTPPCGPLHCPPALCLLQCTGVSLKLTPGFHPAVPFPVDEYSATRMAALL